MKQIGQSPGLFSGWLPIAGDAGLLAAPILAWTSATGVNLPTFQITGPANQQVGDVYTLRRSQDNFLTFEDAVATVTNLAPPTMGTFDFGAVWADGTYQVKCFYRQGSRPSDDSNVVPVTIGAIAAAVLTAPIDTASGQTTADLQVTTNAAGIGGTLYRVVSISATPPTGTQIKAGQMHTGVGAAFAGNAAVAAGGDQLSAASGLTAGTAYWVHFVLENAAGFSNVASGDGFTTQIPVAVLSAPVDTSTGQTTASLSVTTNANGVGGTLYRVISPSATPPTGAQIKAGQIHTGAAAAFAGSAVVSASGAQASTATGLTAGTSYFAHFVLENISGFSNVSSGDGFTTQIPVAVLSAPIDTATSETTASIQVTVGAAGGTCYAILSTSSTAPTAAQIKAGQMHTGAAAAYASSAVLGAPGTQGFTITGLTASTAYFAHFVTENISGFSNVVSGDGCPTFIPDTFLGKKSTIASDGATISGNNFNYTDVDMGPADSRKRLLVLCCHNGGVTKHDALVCAGGFTITKLFSYSTADDTASTVAQSGWIIETPAGGIITGLQLQCNAAAAPARGGAVFYMIGRPGAMTDVLKISNGSDANGIITGAIDIVAGGGLFGLASQTTDLNSCDWGTTLPTEDCDFKISATYHMSSAHKSGGTLELNRTITADWLVNPSNNLRLGVVAFGVQA